MRIEKDILNVSEVSNLLSCSAQKTYKLIKSGALEAYKDVSGRIWKIPDKSIYLYKERQSARFKSIINIFDEVDNDSKK